MADLPKDSGNTLTFMLEGEISLESFAEAVTSFNKLIAGLTAEAGGEIDWALDDLVYSSAIASVRGQSARPERVAKVVQDYVEVGRALQHNAPLKRSSIVVRSARSIARLVGQPRGPRAVRFETAREESIVSHPPKRTRAISQRSLLANPITQPQAMEFGEPVGAYGAIDGTVQTLTNRRGLRFTLYDSLNDRAVSCYLTNGQEEMMRGAWGKHAIVEGWVTRDPSDGHPLSIRDVINVTLLDEGDYASARAIIPYNADDPLPEETIRRLRDD